MKCGSYQQWAQRVVELGTAVDELMRIAHGLGLQDGVGAEWYANLMHKLLPQVQAEAYIVVAVAGGTMVGKSTIFNHLVGYSASRALPYASQTKHPMCAVPRGFLARHDLSAIFPDFQLVAWSSDDDALRDGPENLLVYREDPAGNQPARLLLLDTPDIDGALTANWQRARLIRHASDVLLCILTAEKYNDEAVRRFFQEAADSDKTAMVVFNMIDWPHDRDYCLGWLEAFRRGTGVNPGHTYGVPRLRQAAHDLELPFHGLVDGSTDPRSDLADLHFDEIKIRSLAGALRVVLNDGAGLPSFLRQVEARAAEYRAAKDAIHQGCQVTVEPPVLPSHVVMDEVWKWLEPRRTAFDRTIHWAYGSVRDLLMFRFRSNPTNSEVDFRRKELDALTKALSEIYGRLDLIYKGANVFVKEVLTPVLDGDARAEAFEALKNAHAGLPLLTDSYRDSVVRTLNLFERDNPRTVKAIQAGLFATAVVQPVITVAMFGAGDLVAHGLTTVAVHSTTQIVTAAASGTVVTVLTESTIGRIVTQGQCLFASLFRQFYQERADLLARVIHDCVMGQHLRQIGERAAVTSLSCYQDASRLVGELAAVVSPASHDTVMADAEAPAVGSI